MKTCRPAAVAGTFYPDNVSTLEQMINDFLHQVEPENISANKPIAIIVPHAGYIYSGLTAAYAYQLLSAHKQQIKRVILLGPSHHVAFNGMAAPEVNTFVTPLGEIALDTDEITALHQQNRVLKSDQAHVKEHSLEVQLPFLQTVLNDFTLVPIVVGQTPYHVSSQLIDRYINNPNDLLVISTDLSHFLNYQQAQEKDQRTADLIMNKKFTQLDHYDACGVMPLTGMLHSCENHSLDINQLDCRNSGDTAGDKQRVVGYGSWAIY
ncbi:MAG: AmmeMemoRadiSam system protein B [Gammaproteobacteria bacterium]|nr:AmmeMemoRadiSam system protein B [Gammaproteobacteria bacterium]